MSRDEPQKMQGILADGIAAEGLDDVVLPEEESATKRLADAVSDEAVDRMIADARKSGVSLLDGPDGWRRRRRCGPGRAARQCGGLPDRRQVHPGSRRA